MRIFIAILSFLLLGYNADAQKVYRTPSGNCYHTAVCRTVKNVSTALSLSVAAKQGLRACKICKPTNVQPAGTYKNPSGTQQGTSQCRGITKAGSRCKHKTSMGNVYCFQHQPG